MRSLLALLALASSEAAFGQTVRLCPAPAVGCDYTTFATAVAGVPVGGTIEIESGTYVSADVNITKSLFIRPRPAAVVTLNDPASDVIDVSGVGTVVDIAGVTLDADGDNMQCFWVHGTSTVIGDNITCAPHAQVSEPGGIVLEAGSVMSLRNAVFNDVDSSAAGADKAATISVRGGALTLDSVRITNANGGYAGAMLVTAGGTADLVNVSFANNTGPSGGAIRVEGGTVTIKSGTFTSNTATGVAGTDGGGAISVVTGSATIGAATFTSNTAIRGGAILLNNNAPLTVTGATFTQNRATGGDGGAIASLEAGAVTIDGATFARNTATTTSGAVGLNNVDSLGFYRSWLCDNTAAQGGGLHVAGTAGPVTIANNVFLENLATGVGSAIRYNPATTATIRNNAFLGNSTAASQGALWFANGVWALSNNLIAQTAAGDGVRRASATGTPTFAYNDLFANSAVDFNIGGVNTVLPATNAALDPQLFSYVRGPAGDALGCGTPDLRSRYAAGLRDAGDPATFDRDLSRSDIGPYGGPDAPAFAWVDGDNDGFPWVHDCDDAKPAVHPNVSDICNGIDDDCDGTIDEDPALSWHPDADGDTFGSSTSVTKACVAPPGFIANGTDCLDNDNTAYPGAPETCDGVDDNCDLIVDNNPIDPTTYYADTDVDTFGDKSSVIVSCNPVSGYVTDKLDCDDTRDTTYPGAPEVCNTRDDDCDGSIDESATNTTAYHLDGDKDGFGSPTPSDTINACAPPAGYVADATDCNDKNASIRPGAPEQCNDVDDDCDGTKDDNVSTTDWYSDLDHDGFGDETSSPTNACSAPPDTVDNADDCDDDAFAVNPAATEVCNGKDDDCNGTVDIGPTDDATWYQDADGDDVGDDATAKDSCASPGTDYVLDGGDCDDDDAEIHPGAVEYCDDLDSDCDDAFDDAATRDAYTDADGDGFGDDSTKTTTCEPPSEDEVAVGGDCDDNDPDANPDGNPCDGQDTDRDDRPYIEPVDTGVTDVPGDACGCQGTSTSPSFIGLLAVVVLRRRVRTGA